MVGIVILIVISSELSASHMSCSVSAGPAPNVSAASRARRANNATAYMSVHSNFLRVTR